jgi:hypothetical protein
MSGAEIETQGADVQPLSQPENAAPGPRPAEQEVPSPSSARLSKQRSLLLCLLPLMASIVICVAISVFSPAHNPNDNSLLVQNELAGIKAQMANANSAIASITANINSLEQATGADNKLAQEYLTNAKATLKSAEAQRDRLEAQAAQLSNSISSASPRSTGTLPLWILLAGAIGTVVIFIQQRPRVG